MKGLYRYIFLRPKNFGGFDGTSNFPQPGHQMEVFLLHPFPRLLLNSTVFIHVQIPACLSCLRGQGPVCGTYHLQGDQAVECLLGRCTTRPVFLQLSSKSRKLKTTSLMRFRPTLFHPLLSVQAKNGLCHFPEKKVSPSKT